MQVRGMKIEEIDICLDLMDRSFEDTRRESFKRYFHGDPWFKPEYVRVCEVDSELTSVVQICPRPVRFGISTLLMGGIANVGTPPEHRGKGYASALMEDAVRVMTDDGMHFSSLFTGINPFYERVGYRTVGFNHGAAKLKPSIEPLSSPYRIRSYYDDDAESVVSVYNEFNADVALSAIRTSEYLSRFAIDPETDVFDIWVAETTDGTVVAYLMGHKSVRSYGIAEICCRTGHEQALAALLHVAWKRAVDLEADGIVYRLPGKEVINAAIKEIAIPTQPRLYTSLMMRLLNIRPMFETMQPELVRRSKSLDTGGCVTISTEFGSVTLDASPGRVEISDNIADDRIELVQDQFFYLIFGYRNPSEIIPEGPGMNLLAYLFPRQTPLYYVADGF